MDKIRNRHNVQTVTVGIPAHNEQANIERLLTSVFSQEHKDFVLQKVLLVSDGSTDRTVELAKKMGFKDLEVVNHKQRAGKTARMDELFRRAKSDVLVMFDADTILESDFTLSNLIKPILEHRATLVSGRPKKVDAKSFTDRVMNVSLYLQDQVKLTLKNGKSVYACHGRAVALHRSLFQQLRPPYSAVGNDAYLYFFNQLHGGGFEYAPGAVVLYKMPQSLADFVKQQRRFSTAPTVQAKFFGQEILREYKIPLGLQAKVLAEAILKYNLYALAYIYYRLTAKLHKAKSQAQWEISESTKSI